MPDHFAQFIREAAAQAPIFAVSLQGYEPLVPAARAYTQAVLSTSQWLGLPTGLVTNGTYLTNAIEWLKVVAPTKIAVSVDSADAVIHDKVRRKSGAFAAAIEGLRAAKTELPASTKIVVSSVLLPYRRERLEGMPALLRDLGIRDWIINPLLKVGKGLVGGPVDDSKHLFADLLILHREAERIGIQLTVDDEFARLDHQHLLTSKVARSALRVRTLPKGMDIFRLVPSGHCSMGTEVLKEIGLETPRWTPDDVDAGTFLATLKRGIA